MTAKMHFPILLLLFAVCFSGVPIPKNNQSCVCGPYVTFENFTNIPVSSIQITNNTFGGTVTISNPTFPYTYNDSGIDWTVTYFFAYPVSGNVEMDDASFCTRFDHSTFATINIKVY